MTNTDPRIEQARLAGIAARTADLTVRANGTKYSVPGPLLDAIKMRRNQAALHRNAGNARDEAFTNRALRESVMEALDVGADTACLILAGVRHAPVANWKPDHLDLAVRWDRGWKLYEVTGTRHAYYLLRKLAQRDGFQVARLNTPLVRSDDWILDNVINLTLDDILGYGDTGAYRSLLDRNNSHYDLDRD